MRRVEFKHVELRPAVRFSQLPRIIHYALLSLFLVDWAFVCARLCLSAPPLPNANWPEGLLLALALGTTLASLAQRLPAQNVLLAAAIIAAVIGGLQLLDARTELPFGPFKYNCSPGERLVWAMGIWIIALLNARGVSRLVLRRFRQAPTYGLWVLGFSAVLAVVFELALEPFATQVKNYWAGEPTRMQSTWYGVAWVNFISWGAVALLILAFVTPMLIQKKPGRHTPLYHPLLMWIALSILFFLGVWMRGLRSAAIFTAAQGLLILVAALLGAGRGRKCEG